MDAPLLLTALGVPVDLRVHGPGAAELRAALASRWSLCLRDEADPAARVVDVTYGVDLPARAVDVPEIGGTDLDRLLVDVTQRVTHQAISANIGTLLMFHAAAVCHPDTGAAVVCVAPGGTGKTTLSRTLGRGRGYVTDETVGVTDDGSIVPYPKPLSVRRPEGPVKDEVEPASLGLRPSRVPPHVAGLLLLDRTSDGPDTAEVEELELFDAIIGCTPETSSLSRLPQPLQRLAYLIESLPLVARVRYREAASLEPLVREAIGPGEVT